MSPRIEAGTKWESIRRALRVHHAPCAVTMGTFDGVHAGHRSLVSATRGLALPARLPVVAVTFSPRPEQFFQPDKALPDLCSIEERVRRLREAGADEVVVLPFGKALATASAAAFAQALSDDLGLRLLCVGEDFSCGRNREGTPDRLRELGLDVHVHPFLRDEHGTKVSSSVLRVELYASLRLGAHDASREAPSATDTRAAPPATLSRSTSTRGLNR
jgi:FAD synthase